MTKQHMYTKSETAESAVPAQTFANTSDCNLTQLIILTAMYDSTEALSKMFIFEVSYLSLPPVIIVPVVSFKSAIRLFF